MLPLRLLFIWLAFVLTGIPARADEWQKLRARGGEVYFLDADVRAAFAKDAPKTLPEAKRKLPPVTAPAFDWTTLATRPYSYTQKKSPFCWAFGTITALEWNWAIRNGGPAPVLAVQPIIDRTQKEAGASIRVALEALVQQGTCALNGYPFEGKPGKLRTNVVFSYRAVAWGEVAPGTLMPTETQIKQALLDHGTLVADVFVTPQFDAYKSGVFREHFKGPEGKAPVNHSITIVGWDDRKGKGCWKIQNSWGPQWGEGGYMWIEYGCNNIGAEACWIRPQSIHYLLPEDAHKLVPGDVAPFHKWTKATAVTPPLPPTLPAITPAEALKKQGERVLVQFTVKGYGTTTPTNHVELFSETSRKEESCLIVRLLNSELGKFPSKDPKVLYEMYRGKEVRIRGSMQPVGSSAGTRLVLEVADPGQIEVVK